MPEPVRHSIGHLYALDVACAMGIEVEIDRKAWTLSPLTFGDAAKVMVRARSEAMQAYNEASKHTQIDYMQRGMDLTALLFGTAPQMAFTDPATQRYQVELSLRRKHAKEPDAEIQKVIDVIFDDEKTALQIVTAVGTMTHGPHSEEELKTADSDGDANPTAASTAAP